MEIKSLDELRAVDPMVQAFTPWGFAGPRALTPEDAVRFQQEVMARLELAPDVAESPRRSFDRLRTVYAHGAFCYDIYTLVDDHALLVIEQALRDRFVEYYRPTGATFVETKSGVTRHLDVDDYHDVHEFLDSNRKPMQLGVAAGVSPVEFGRGMLSDLMRWARAAGLLGGQRNRHIEAAIRNLRNEVAHPNGYGRTMPNEAARTMSDLAEIINRLWGHATPGGRLCPAPVRREIMTIGLSRGHGSVTALAAHLSELDEAVEDPNHVIVVRAVHRDPELHEFHSRYEATAYPAEWLWGPGPVADALAWLEAEQPAPDDCDYLDRIFAVRHVDGDLFLPMRPDVAAALPSDDRAGTWYVVRADHPNDAYSHVRNRLTGEICQDAGACKTCPVEFLQAGAYDEISALLSGHAGGTPSLPPLVRAPLAFDDRHTIT